MVEIAGLVGTLKAVTGLAKLALETKTEEKAKEIAAQLGDSIISLQSQVLDIQSQYSSLRESERSLKEQINQLEKWKDKASKYELKELAPGVLVYSLKPVIDSSEPPHYVCTKCYEDGKSYILNSTVIPDYKGVHYTCPNCSTRITDPTNKKHLGQVSVVTKNHW